MGWDVELACTAAVVVFQMNVDGVVVIVVHVVSTGSVQFLLLQRHSGDILECSLDINGVLGTGLEERVVQATQLIIGDVKQLLL